MYLTIDDLTRLHRGLVSLADPATKPPARRKEVEDLLALVGLSPDEPPKPRGRRLSEFFAGKRLSQRFLLRNPQTGQAVEVCGWDTLISTLRLSEPSIRTRLSGGRGEFSATILIKGRSFQDITVSRLSPLPPGEDPPAFDPKSLDGLWSA